MAARSVITLTTAPAGSGKTYRRCAHFLINDFLPHGDGVHWSNFPVYRDILAQATAKRTGQPVEQILERIQVIPEPELKAWERGDSGPWAFFDGRNLQNCHVAIDEIHNFCGTKSPKEVKAKWQAWLGEIRHRGATIEFISQSPKKIATEIDAEAGLRLSLVNSEDRRDPWFRIPLGDWYELRAKFLTGVYRASVWEIEYRDVDGKWKQQDKRIFPLDPYYFQFYDSYSAPQKGGNKGEAKKREFETRTHLGLLWWFVRRSWIRVASRCLIIAAFFFVLCGGGQWMFGQFLGAASAAAGGGIAKMNANKPASTLSNSGPSSPSASASSSVSSAASQPASPPASQPAIDPEVAKAQAQADQLRQQVQELTDARQRLEKTLKENSAVVLITKDSVTFRDGLSFHLGERIDTGFYQGKVIFKIDYPKRIVELDDGTHLRMGYGVEHVDGGIERLPVPPTTSADPNDPAGVREPLRPTQRRANQAATRPGH